MLAFTGDGATSQGDFHEALNVAAVWDLPVVFVVEEIIGVSVHRNTNSLFLIHSTKGPAYGMKTMSFNANDLLEASSGFSKAANTSGRKVSPFWWKQIRLDLEVMKKPAEQSIILRG